MITIDGSYGEGGGQIVRTALGLAAIAGQPLTIKNVRAGRSKPGLQRQHLCAVRAVAKICSAKLEGAELNSRELQFFPQGISGGHYELDIGTAGSTTLVAQSILVPLLRANGPSTACILGCTHNPMAPPYRFFDRIYVPLLHQMGINISSRLSRYGLFPKGGGQIELQMDPPSSMHGIGLSARGDLKSTEVYALVASLPAHIAEREIREIVRRNGWRHSQTHLVEIENDTGPGNVVMIELQFENCRHLITEFGRRGVRAEQVAS